MTILAYVIAAVACFAVSAFCISEAAGARNDAKFIALFVAGWSSLVGCVAFIVMVAGGPAPF